MTNLNHTGPYHKTQVGRFQITLWRKTRILRGRRDYQPDREITQHTACVQHSRYDSETNEWRNQSIWCQPDELRDLVQALDRLNEDEVPAIPAAAPRP